MTGGGRGLEPFDAHVELLEKFLAHRGEIVDRLEGLLNAQRRPVEYLLDRALLSSQCEDCFFSLPAISPDEARLRGRLDEAHWASGFEPRRMPELHNDLVHPAEMMRRAFYCWQQTRWPGRNGRVRFAETLFNLYLIRCLELLSMRLWDAEPADASARLAKLQHVLDALWKSSPADQPVLLRDARWLVPLAQSPTTDELAAYFDVAERVAETLGDADRLEIQKAHVLMIGGHLRSQIRHYCMQDGVPLNDESVIRRTRTSNALDFALLIQHLVGLLDAYDRARQSGDDSRRLELADVICQGISPDPELFVQRVDLLAAYGMIDYLFAAADDDGRVAYTPMGRRHVEHVERYAAAIGRLAEPLYADCRRFKPVDGAYSPYGVLFGTPTNLIEHMAFKTIQRDAVTHLGLEDVFVAGDAEKVAWVDGWRQLPHIDREVQKQHAYPQSFADEIFARIEHALRERAAGADDAVRTGRLLVHRAEALSAESPESAQELPARFVVSSDPQIVAAGKAMLCDETKLLRDRQEGHFVVAWQTPGGWLAVKKDMLSEVLGAGRDASIAGLPTVTLDTLKLMCPAFIGSDDPGPSRQASAPPSMLNA